MRFRILGPLRIWDGTGWLSIGAAQQRVVLAVLLTEAGRVVTTDRLLDELWGEHPPRAAVSTLQNLVLRLRRALGPGPDCPLATRNRGYELGLSDDDLDARVFEGLVVAGRHTLAEGRPEAALAQLSQGLALWRGGALVDVPASPTVTAHAARLEQARLAALEERLGAQLDLGRHDDVVDELRGLVTEHPLRERLWAHLMVALYRCGRRAEALEAYRRAYRDLAEQIGVEPGPALRELHHAMLADEPGLTFPVRGRVAIVPAQLPADLPGFVGRVDQLARLDALLPGADRALRVVAITGTAGVGKTALAVRWARQVSESFPDGQFYVDLRGYAAGPPVRPIDVLGRFLPALGVPPQDIPTQLEPAAALYRSVLTGRRVLVLLDNAGHADQVRPLLPGDPECLVLVTSRHQLGGLVARHGMVRLALDVLTPAEAHALLCRLLGADRVGAEPQAASELARLCGHLPLALRIAAARLTAGRRASIAGYTAQLRRDRLAALQVDGDPQAAVRVALDHSYAAVPSDARRLFRLLGLVPGPDITAPAAAALADVAFPGAARLLDRLTSIHLLDEHLPGRYAMHDLVRLYAATRCAGDREVPAAVDRLYSFYQRRVDAAAELLYPQILRAPPEAGDAGRPDVAFDDHAHASSWLDAERANLVAAVRHAAEHGPRASAWRLADSLRGYLHQRRYTVDWSAVAEAGLAAAQAEDDGCARAAAHLSLALLHWVQGDYVRATSHYSSARAHAGRTGWAEGESTALGNLGIVYWTLGRLADAGAHIEAALVIDRRTGWPAGQASKLVNLGAVCFARGRLAEAAECHLQSLALYGQATSHAGIAMGNLGEVYHALGRFADARATLTSALALHRQVGNWHFEADTVRMLAALHLDTGQPARGRRLARTALARARAVGDRPGEAAALTTLAGADHRTGRWRRAVDTHRWAVGIARDIGHRHLEVEALVGLATAQRLAGRPGRAVDAARTALRIARGAEFRLLEGQARTALAEIELTRGRPARALHHAEAALAAHRATGHVPGQRRTTQLIERARRRIPAGARAGRQPPTIGPDERNSP